jgi:hypothetical protein
VRALTGANLPTIRLEPHENRKQKRLALSTTSLAVTLLPSNAIRRAAKIAGPETHADTVWNLMYIAFTATQL